MGERHCAEPTPLIVAVQGALAELDALATRSRPTGTVGPRWHQRPVVGRGCRVIVQRGNPFADLAIDAGIGEQRHVPEPAQRRRLHVVRNCLRSGAAERHQPVADQPAKAVFDVLGQAGSEKAIGDVPGYRMRMRRARSLPEIPYSLTARGGDPGERQSDLRGLQARGDQVAKTFER